MLSGQNPWVNSFVTPYFNRHIVQSIPLNFQHIWPYNNPHYLQSLINYNQQMLAHQNWLLVQCQREIQIRKQQLELQLAHLYQQQQTLSYQYFQWWNQQQIQQQAEPIAQVSFKQEQTLCDAQSNQTHIDISQLYEQPSLERQESQPREVIATSSPNLKTQVIDSPKLTANTEKSTVVDSLTQRLFKNKFFKHYLQDKGKYPYFHSQDTSNKCISQNDLMQKLTGYCIENDIPYETEGLCHGLTLTWLTLMSLNAEEFFYKFYDLIVEYPKDKLHEIHHIIKFFIGDLINYAQNPQNYSKLIYSNVDEIIGESYKQKFFDHPFRHKQQVQKTMAGIKTHEMICAVGWGYKKGELDKNELKGHSVGIYKRNDTYHVFDSNYLSARPKQFVNSKKAEHELWKRLVLAQGFSIEKELRINFFKTEFQPHVKNMLEKLKLQDPTISLDFDSTVTNRLSC